MTIPEMEVFPHRDLNTKEAKVITERIRSSMGGLMAEVAKAFLGRAWVALGYDSWADYIKGEFSHAPLLLPREERQAVVALLRGQGMSTRAIGSATGTDHVTVMNDLAGGENSPSEAVPVTGLDGKNYTVTCPDPETTEAAQPAPPKTITCPTCGGTGKVTP